MPFKGITFSGQNVTPKNDGGLYNAHYGDGILWGCEMSIMGDDLVIQSGEFIACGRVCQVDGSTNVDLSLRTLTNGYIQVVMDFDISKPEGNQWNIHTPLIESATTTFPALTKDNINGTGTLYQIALAVVQISGGNLTSIVSSMYMSGINASDNDGSIIKINSRDGAGAFIETLDSNGDPLGGVQFASDGRVLIYGNGTNYIQLRPNGRTDPTSQVSFGTNGQQINGHLYNILEVTTPSNKSSGYTAIQNFALGTGLYLLQAQATVRPTAVGVASLNIGYDGTQADFVTGRQALYCSNTSDYWSLNAFGLVEVTGTHNYTMFVYCQNNYSLTHWKYAWTRLA